MKEIQSIIPKITFSKGVKVYRVQDTTYIVIIGDDEKEVNKMIQQTNFQELLNKNIF